MRPFVGGLLIVWGSLAHAGVQRTGVAISGDSYDAVLADDAHGVGCSLTGAGGETAASLLRLRDGDASCTTTSTRSCAIVVELPEWILRQCERAEPCTASTTSTTWQSFWSTDIALATWIEWSDAGAEQGLFSANLATTAGAQLTWWTDAAGASQSADAGTWSLADCSSLGLSLPTAAGPFNLGALWSGVSPASCVATSGAELTVDLARAAPQNNASTSLFALVGLDSDPTAPAAALATLLESPTDSVTVGSRWIVDDDDVVDGLGLGALALDPDELQVAWTAAPTDGRARQHVRYLVRGVADIDRELSAYRDGSVPLEHAVLRRLELTATHVYNSAREWEPWESGDIVCMQNNQWCFQAASPFPFSGLELDLASTAPDLAGDWQYWDGSAWSSLSLTAANDTANLAASGTFSWTLPADWEPGATDVDGTVVALYAVRLRSNPGFGGTGAAVTAVAPDLALFEPGIVIDGPTELRLTFNQPPIATVEPANIDVAVDETAVLDGSASSDPEGATLTYAWQQSSGPADAELTSANEAEAAARLPESGLYVFELVVNDGDLGSTPAYVVVRAGTFADTDRGCDCATTSPWALLVLLGLRRRQGRTVK